jgi:MoaA/NifB/PqqE/SkfB family radical SAM enzyme
MKFPFRLSLDLWRRRIAQTFASGKSEPLIFHLPAAMLPALHEHDAGTAAMAQADGHTAADSVRMAAHSTAPVLWIGGGEPLDHAETGRVAFALNGKGRNVFVHTDGQLLRRRIHEFRTEERLFLTVELAGREEAHDAAVGKPGAFRRVIEGIRAAKLSGFHVCAHVTVGEQSDVCQVGGLFEYLDRYDVDGYIVSSGGLAGGLPGVTRDLLQEKFEEILPLIRCRRWENFSRLLEASYAGFAATAATDPVTTGVQAAASEAEPVEETV